MSLRIGYDGEPIMEEFDDLADVSYADSIADVGAFMPRRRGGGRVVTPGRSTRVPARGALPGQVMAPAQGYGYGGYNLPYGAAVPAGRLIPNVPGAPAIGIRLQPLGFPVTSFTATSGTALAATSRPQRPFKPKRLVCDVGRTGTTSNGLVTVTELSIGTNNQFVSRQPIGIGAFAPGAFDTNMELAASTTALDITVGFAVTVAPTMTDRIDIATTLMGESIG